MTMTIINQFRVIIGLFDIIQIEQQEVLCTSPDGTPTVYWTHFLPGNYPNLEAAKNACDLLNKFEEVSHGIALV
jgi:hypothetical protein